MCDTLIAPAAFTRRGRTLFAKNSDRERGEAQGLEAVPAQDAPTAGGRATFIDLDAREATFACLLSRPFNHWGAEMGANARGVVVGNEAVHAKGRLPRAPALTGLDLVRLALEGGSTARRAADVLTAALERYGQGGDCGYRRPFYYHNSFVIADDRNAFVVETRARAWALIEVRGPRALSNAYSIETADEGAGDVLGGSRALCADWSDPKREAPGQGPARRRRAEARLAAGPLGPLEMMAILRDHGEGPFDPALSPRKSLCMHAAGSGYRSQSVASWVSELSEAGAVHWATATSAPCLSLFKPLYLDALPGGLGGFPSGVYDQGSLWWRHEVFHRAALADLTGVVAAIAPERDRLEADFLAEVDALEGASPDRRRAATAQMWRAADAVEARWRATFRPEVASARRGYRQGWRRDGQDSLMPEAPETETIGRS